MGMTGVGMKRRRLGGRGRRGRQTTTTTETTPTDPSFPSPLVLDRLSPYLTVCPTADG
jgi:hypothetical protein